MTSLVLMYFTSCVNTDFWLDKITPESRHTRELRYLLQKSVPWAGKTPNMYRFCWKVELLSTFCKNFSQPATTWFVARQVGTWEVKRATSFSTCFAAMLQNKLHVFVSRFTVSWFQSCLFLLFQQGRLFLLLLLHRAVSLWLFGARKRFHLEDWTKQVHS